MVVTRAESTAWPWLSTAIGFRPEYLDFSRGIRVGNLEPHERITKILKGALEARYGQEFVTERWGRGVFWQWIGFLNRTNRSAKPVSSGVSFGCSKFYVSVDTDERRFTCGLQVERGTFGRQAAIARVDSATTGTGTGWSPGCPRTRPCTTN